MRACGHQLGEHVGFPDAPRSPSSLRRVISALDVEATLTQGGRCDLQGSVVLAQLKALNVDQGEAPALVAKWAALKIAVQRYGENLPIQ
jgi:hypothetical protein